jgi:hypothetical protein
VVGSLPSISNQQFFLENNTVRRLYCASPIQIQKKCC